MKIMKKGFLFVLLFVCFLCINVNAATSGSYITVISNVDLRSDIVYNGEVRDTFEGIEYIEDSNTLVLDNVTANQIQIPNMGDDFKIELKGVNHLEFLYLQDTNATITGEGTLIVDSRENANSEVTSSIYLVGTESFLRISNESTVKVYSKGNVLAYLDSRNSTTVRFIFDNGLDISDQLEFRPIMTGSEQGDYRLPLQELIIEPREEQPAQEEPAEQVENPYTGTGMILIIDAIILLGVLGFAVKTLKKA